MLRHLLLFLLVLPAAAHAQVPTDTIPRPPVAGDTTTVEVPPEGMVRDTLPFDSLRRADPDSLLPAPHIPRLPEPRRASWAVGRWEWDRQALQRQNPQSLLDLLEQVPGLVVTSAGGFGHPAGVTALGQGGGRLRVFRDGLELDPLHQASYDLQQIGLLDLDLVQVERTLIETRVHLRTFQLSDRRPFSEIEVGTGNYQARFLRALVARPVLGRSVVSAAYDLSSANGYFHNEPFSFTSGRIRWDYSISAATGVQLEFLQSGVSRESEAYPTDFDRREIVLRTRSRVLPGLTIEGLLGRTLHRPVGFERDSLGVPLDVGPATDTTDLRRSSTQGSIRAMLAGTPGWVEAGSRFRHSEGVGFREPAIDLSVRAGLRPLAGLALEGEARSTSGDGAGGVELGLTARTGPVLGFSLFGSLSQGERRVQARRDSVFVVTDTVGTGEGEVVRERVVREMRYVGTPADVGGARFGAEWSGGGSRVGAAAIRVNATEVVPFGLGFDRHALPVPGEPLTGLETFASVVPPALRGVRLDGWYTRWTNGASGRPYVPREQGRVTLGYHTIRRSGQFEPTARLEAIYRGPSLVPVPGDPALAESDPYALLNFYLQLRILDVRAFFTYQNLLNESEAFDVPGRVLPGPRTMYGIRWFFRN